MTSPKAGCGNHTAASAYFLSVAERLKRSGGSIEIVTADVQDFLDGFHEINTSMRITADLKPHHTNLYIVKQEVDKPKTSSFIERDPNNLGGTGHGDESYSDADPGL